MMFNVLSHTKPPRHEAFFQNVTSVWWPFYPILKEIRFEDACSIAEGLDFVKKGGKGSHCTYGRADESMLLNFQNRDGLIKPYQARQLIKMVKKYG